MQNQYLSINYRRDIDGLRAFAVLSVILYHAFPKAIPGGFVGVDIFFVISGFLITSILLKNFENNNFSLWEFYTRRIKRIFPALILVLFSCIGLGWFLLTAPEYTQISIHAKASTTFYTNFILAKEAGYFDVSAHAKPLMHLWSLAVEEQFYIFWPLLLYYVTRKNFNVILFCIGIIILSFFISIKTLSEAPIKSFYFPLCRAWELVSGSLLAYFAQHKIKIIEYYKAQFAHNLKIHKYKDSYLFKKNILIDLLSIIGFIIIISSIILIRKNSFFPGWLAIWPVIGTLLLLMAGEGAWINKTILSNKVFVWIGLISYPLYLWHWPLLSFTYILNGQNADFKEVIVIILISFILSWLTYKLVEQPIRAFSKKRSVVVTLIILLASIGLFSYNIEINKGYAFRTAHSIDSFTSYKQAEELALNFTVNCASPHSKKINKKFEDPYCMANTSKPRFLTIGDSHAFTFAHSATIYNTLDIAMIYLTGHPPSLSYISHNPLDHVKEKRKEQIELYRNYLDNLIETYESVEYIILVSRGPLYISGIGYGIEEQSYNELNKWKLEKTVGPEGTNTNGAAFKEGYIEFINSLLSKGKKVIFVIDYPELGIDPATCFKRPFSFSHKKVADCSLQRKAVDNRQKEYRELVKEIAQLIPSLIIYDPIDAFCDQSKCYGKRGDTIYYRDNNHLNFEGTKLLIDDFIRWLKKHEEMNY